MKGTYPLLSRRNSASRKKVERAYSSLSHSRTYIDLQVEFQKQEAAAAAAAATFAAERWEQGTESEKTSTERIRGRVSPSNTEGIRASRRKILMRDIRRYCACDGWCAVSAKVKCLQCGVCDCGDRGALWRCNRVATPPWAIRGFCPRPTSAKAGPKLT